MALCETCGGARFSEFDYPHHLVEGLDACLCEETYAAAMASLPVSELIERMRGGLIDVAYGAAMEMARREEEETTEAMRYFGAIGEETISCGVCGRPMDRGADAHRACKSSR